MNPKQEDESESDGQEYFPQKTNAFEKKGEPEDIIEQQIMQEIQQEQKKNKNTQILCSDVEFKLQQILEDIQEQDGKNFQSIISLRMKQLAYNKILVLTYERSYFRLVQALFHIGRQYLKFNCLEQAQKHLEDAEKNNKRASQNQKHKLYHSYILSALGQCFYRCEKIDNSLTQLQRAINIQTDFQKDHKKTVNNIKTLTLLAKVKSQVKHEDSLKTIQIAAKKAAELVGEKSRIYGSVLRQYASIYRNIQKNDDAIRMLDLAVSALKMSNQPQIQLDIIILYQQLCELYEPKDISKYLETLRLRFEVFENYYGNADKKTIKEQRTLATALLKYNLKDQSLEEFDDILEKQQKVYGQNSIEVGKEYKTIGDLKATEANFKKALKIFHDLGDQRLARQIRMKLSSIQQN